MLEDVDQNYRNARELPILKRTNSKIMASMGPIILFFPVASSCIQNIPLPKILRDYLLLFIVGSHCIHIYEAVSTKMDCIFRFFKMLGIFFFTR